MPLNYLKILLFLVHVMEVDKTFADAVKKALEKGQMPILSEK